MDIWLINSEGRTQLCPESVHGMLWLQTHFEDDHWEAIASRKVRLSLEDAKSLLNDAKEAGLKMSQLPAISIPKNL